MYYSSEGIEIPQDQAQFRHYDDEGNEYWEVDKILDRKIDYSDHRRVKYLVSWKGFGPDNNTWEPIDNLETVLDDVAEFEEKLKQQKKAAKQSKAPAKSQPRAKKVSTAKPKKGFETKIEENPMNIEQEPSSPIKDKSKLDESDSEQSVRIKKKARNSGGKSSAQRNNKQNSNEDSTASSNTPANKPPLILTEISSEASKENILTPNKVSTELLPPSNIDPAFQNLSKLMEVEEKPSPVTLNNENNDFQGEGIPLNVNEGADNIPQEYVESQAPVPQVVKQEFGADLGAKIASDKTKKNLENMFDDLDNAIEVEDFNDNDEEGGIIGPTTTNFPPPSTAAQNPKKINVAEAIKSRNIVIESDEEEEKISRKYSDNSKKDISPREVGRQDSGSRSPFEHKDSRDHKKNYYDKHSKYDKHDDYKGKDRYYDQKKKRDRSRSHDRDREKDHHRDYRDKERERERERDKDRYKSKDKPSHSHSHSHHNDTQKHSKSSSYNDKRDKSITPTNRDNQGGKRMLATKVGRVSAFADKPSNSSLGIRKSTGMMVPRSYLASKACTKSASLFSKRDSSDGENEEEDNYNALKENHKTSTKEDKSKSPDNQKAQESLKDKSKSPVNRGNQGIEIKGVEKEIIQEGQPPKKREVVKKTLYAKNELKKDMEEELGRYYKGLVGDYLKGKVNKEKFVEMLSVEGNFKEDQVQDILFMSWEGKATVNPQDYYFKVVWKTRKNGLQMPSRLVSWSELLKESPENVAEFVMKKLLNIVTKYGTFGEC